MAKKDSDDAVKCPICEMLDCLMAHCDRVKSSKFAEHLRGARTEVLLAIRSVIDERIETLKKETATPKRAKKIKVKEAD